MDKAKSFSISKEEIQTVEGEPNTGTSMDQTASAAKSKLIRALANHLRWNGWTIGAV
ncbi:hypothetical protein [Methylomicrobium lacus]|uniref:hypothetical protein n=1 Tax=Methylomicrobium lacus TaxID=136992 RepID=UPI0035A87FB5